MLNMSRTYYKDNQAVLAQINEFEQSYCSSTSITWYTKNTFLFRMLNQVLRQENVTGIFQLRYFIKDLYLQLRELHSQYIKSLSQKTKILTVYRGQTITINQLQQLKENISSIIYVNTFLSTTTDKEVALIYAGVEGSYLVSVLFEINIDTSIATKPFANIEDYSYHKDENEILFALGTMYKIVSVSKFENGHIWIIKLSYDNDVYLQTRILTRHLTRNMHEPIIVCNSSTINQKSFGDLNNESTIFMWNYLLLKIILQMENDQNAKTDMINVCRHFYKNDKIVQ
ncbi:unnamed protein product [Didymodactylos carnosus]|uniref:NAD(P)(+)--arginine ADP-ribosyltransferase n=1 Tax=Didymodactylos carnosus TaxID=1234261 RepID=A0A8S2ER12_9BILA|nr:unnamed protein product [Didymodactylos carnosus]CAF4024165.1 unnamed protein product [Didymodactylos carnosus]